MAAAIGTNTGIAMKVLFLAVCWWTASVVVALSMKRVLSSVNGSDPIFPYSYLWTAILNVGVALWALLAGQVLRIWGVVKYSAHASLHWSEFAVLVFLGCLQGVELAFSNMSYQYLSVATTRMVIACTVVIQLATAIAWRLERITPLKWMAAGVLVFGALVENLECSPDGPTAVAFICGSHHSSSHHKGNDSWPGVVFITASVTISANRWALTQNIFQRSRQDSALRTRTKFQLLPFMSIGTVSMNIILAGCFQGHAYVEILKSDVVTKLFIPAVMVSFCIAVLTISELLIVSITAATVMVILAGVHNIPIMLAGIFVNHDQVFRNQWIGFALCTIGAAMYFYARSSEERRDESLCTREMALQVPVLSQD